MLNATCPDATDDLSRLPGGVSARGISVLNTLDQDCRTAGTYWAIVGSPFVRRLLRIGDPGDRRS